MLENAVRECMFALLAGLQQGNKSDFLFLVQERANILLNELQQGFFLRQVFKHQIDRSEGHTLRKVLSLPLLPENDNPHFHFQLTMVK